jgi:hypothetical protein
MEVSLADLGSANGGLAEARSDELTVDRLFAVGEPVVMDLAGSTAVWDSRGQVKAHSIKRAVATSAAHHRDLRAHHQPILPLSLYALVRSG